MPYKVNTDSTKRVIEVQCSGFLTDAECQSMKRDILMARTKIGPGDFSFIYDARDQSIQAPDIVEQQSQLSATIAEAGAARIAVVTTSALFRRQVARALRIDIIEIFDSLEDARSWLDQRP